MRGEREARSMIVEIGHFALVLALAVALVQMTLPAWGAQVRDGRLMQIAEPAAFAQLGLIALAFAALTYGYVTSDFSVENVWANSHSDKPLLYKISGVWGNHEGSMVLWVLILALFGAAVAFYGTNLPESLRANVLAVQAGIAVAFLAFIVFASNPFSRIPLQPEGRGLNPILQDPALAFLALTHAYVTSDFSVETVWANSHSAKPLIYKISGVWGNHEGSMLLWVLILALFGAGVALFGGNLPATLRANVLAVQAGIAVAFLLFILLASNPFARIPPQPEGRGLNPILQDPALAFHPPFLYAGYVGLSIAFSFAVAALIEGRTDAAWARWVRPWTLAAWICLTLGIAMGSW